MPLHRLVPDALAALALSATLLAPQGHVGAHSILIESVPAQGAKLSASPQTALLRFNARIEPAVTRVSLVEGRRRTALEISKKSAVDRVIVRLPPLAPGVYSLVYKVLAIDGHVTQGMIQFTVLPSEASP